MSTKNYFVEIVFTKHAKEKFAILVRHKFFISIKQVLITVQSPDIIDSISRRPLFIAQKRIDATHVLRVIYKHEAGVKKIITFYPGRMNQYGKQKRKN